MPDVNEIFYLAGIFALLFELPLPEGRGFLDYA
jgi:hypothetical protein